ncbi:16S rRNA (cytidine(1402)-2'-O)-methyltransferase [Olavius algarvensis spirochete endosymbiont]|nr:16S rRNA (cytidine(1402)-2'-O)-methyltransferase [Olavius algarvensis spirochete endosymbiont]
MLLYSLMSTLFVVATPIGNLEDITFRAVRILKEVDIIASEDTRQTRILLTKYNIKFKQLISCRARNEVASAKNIVKLLGQGFSVAYVSDAGTPAVSDPGTRLVSMVRKEGFKIVPLPGASAVTTLISVAGMGGKGFLFEGFLSPKAMKRRRRLQKLLESGMIFVIYESPYRIIELCENLDKLCPNRNIFVGRELTKKFEEYIFGKAYEVLSMLSVMDRIRGEFTVLVGI